MERRPIVLIDGCPRELPDGDTVYGSVASVPIQSLVMFVPENTSMVAVDMVDILDTLMVNGNLAII